MKKESQGKSKDTGMEWGGKGGFTGQSGANIFTCPECNGEQAFPGAKQDEPPQCPKCAIPMKAKYVQD